MISRTLFTPATSARFDEWKTCFQRKDTRPLQNSVLVPPVSMSYLRAKSSFPSLPTRNTDRQAGRTPTPFSVRTGTDIMLATTRILPLASKEKVRGCIPRVSAFWMSVGSPVTWLIEKTAMLFSPPTNTRLPSKSTVPLARFAT